MSLKQCEEVRGYLPTSHLSHFRSIEWSFTHIGLNCISHLSHMDVILRKKCKTDAIREENGIWISQFLFQGLYIIKSSENDTFRMHTMQWQSMLSSSTPIGITTSQRNSLLYLEHEESSYCEYMHGIPADEIRPSKLPETAVFYLQNRIDKAVIRVKLVHKSLIHFAKWPFIFA